MKLDRFEANRTRQALDHLFQAGVKAADELVQEVATAVRIDALEEGNPDATATFTEVLSQAGRFTLEPSRFVGGDQEALNACCVARVFLELARAEPVLPGQSDQPKWGWCSLSQDAQGWCWSVLRSSKPLGLSGEAQNAFEEARAFVREFFPVPEKCPYERRIPEQVPSEDRVSDIVE